MAKVTLEGNTVNTNGELPKVGTKLPDFRLVNRELGDITLADFAGKRKIFNIVPSIDTGVCAISTKKFNELCAGRDDTVVLIVSSDLPFALNRFTDENKLSNVVTLSLMRSRNFAKDYGVLITDGPLTGITARAVIVADKDNTVKYTQLVPEITQEPDYDSALAAVS